MNIRQLTATLFVPFFLVMTPFQLNADQIFLKDFVTRHAWDVLNAETKEEKLKLISAPLNHLYLMHLREGERENPRLLTDFSTGVVIKTNLLALAISLGEVAVVARLLAFVDDVNADSLAVIDSRHSYSLAHVALDPIFPSSRVSSLGHRLEIIDLLGKKGIDFTKTAPNARPAFDTSQVSFQYSGWLESKYEKTMMRARALLYGADPVQAGLLFPVPLLNIMDPVFTNAFNMYLELVGTGSAGLRPIPAVTEVFRKIRDARLAMLQQLAF